MYILFVGVPITLLVQHVYAVTNENFKKYNSHVSIGIISVFTLISYALGKSQILSVGVCVETICVAIGTVVIAYYAHKSDPPIENEVFQIYEGVFSCVGIVFGIICIIFTQTSYFIANGNIVCSSNEMVFSKVLYMILGSTYIIYNRMVIWCIYRFYRR